MRGEDHVSNTATHIQMFEAISGKAPDFAHLALIADADGGKLSKRLGSLSVHDIRTEEGLEPMSLLSLMARLGSSDPIEAYTTVKPLIESFDFSKFSRSTPKFDSEELVRLNAKILHETSFENIQDRLKEEKLNDMDELFWNVVKCNIAKLRDSHEWWDVAHGPVQPIIEQEDAAFTHQAADLLPPAPWDENTWHEWIAKIKEESGRKGKTLFMPLRKALTGKEHGPELPNLLPLSLIHI